MARQQRLTPRERAWLTSRLHELDADERRSPFRESPVTVASRIRRALADLPEEWREPARWLFALTRYLSRPELHRAWRSLWATFQEQQAVRSPTEVLVLELDRDTLRDDFYRANCLPGRLDDNLPFRSSHDLASALWMVEAGRPPPEYAGAIRALRTRSHWVLLADLGLSGASIAAEVDRLTTVQRIIHPLRPVRVTCLIQAATDRARERLAADSIGHIAAIRLVNSISTLPVGYADLPGEVPDAVTRFCRWFADHHVAGSGHRLGGAGPDTAAFGRSAAGLLVVTHKNTPDSTVPPLWLSTHSPPYRAPFERLESRVGLGWTGRKEWYARLRRDDALRTRLSHLVSRM
ncbi:phosphoribosyltransferase-like protein [Virgisporangium ochraceum]|nr:hypothetical protein [Virgisporangium ochraceum]